MARFDSTCWSVVLGAAAGDPIQREEFCRRYDPVIRAYLSTRWRIARDHEDVSDAVQEVFMQCFREHGALERVDPDRPGGLRAFLYGVTSRTAIELERRRARWRRDAAPGAPDPDLIARVETTLSQAFDREWAAMIGREARRLLARRAAEGGEAARRRLWCLEQRYFHGVPPRELGPRLGLEPQRISELLREARIEYRVALLEIMASYFPSASERELEERCRELAGQIAS